MTIQQLASSFHHSLASCHITEYVIAWCEPQRELSLFSCLVVEVKCVFAHRIVVKGRTIHFFNFFFAEEFFQHNETILLVLGDLLSGENGGFHFFKVKYNTAALLFHEIFSKN